MPATRNLRRAVRLSDFILQNVEAILQGWEDFARSIPAGTVLSVSALRDDAERMLRFIAADLETAQSDQQQFDKSIGKAPPLPPGEQSAAMDHGLARALDRFSLAELVAEYRALRASVTRLWLEQMPTTAENAMQLVRFNEAVDQILAESVVRFTAKLDSDADLFTASVSHDLRNPVNAVVMSVGLLNASKTLSEPERLASARIERSAKRIEAMLAELHDFTRVRLGGATAYNRQPTEIAQVCRDLIDEVRASNPGRRIILTQSGDTVANVDGHRIGQLVGNLLANAIQHGSPTAPIEVHVTGDDRSVGIEVHNEGPPIAADELRDIFEPLRRGSSRSMDADGGLGLGLYIARTIAVAHGGSIEVVSTAAAGTTFSVRLARSGYPG
jgi:signal transduction histidine kinase